MSKIWFTSDTHLDHTLVANGRGFDNTADHDRVLAENWDRVVSPADTVFVLGDIAINFKRAKAHEWFRARPGIKHLISGNHDETHNMHTKSLQAQMKPLWRDTFGTINDWTRLKMLGRTVLLSHFPYDGEGDRNIPDRNVEYRLRDEGLPLLHGHEHAKHAAHTSLKGSPMLHVGLDAWDLNLVPHATVLEWLEYLP